MIGRIVESFTNNLIVENRYQMILDGLQVTLLVTFCAIVLGTLLGGLVCWMRMSKVRWLRQTAKVYIDLMRGTPVLVFLMLMYYVFMAPLQATGIVVAIVTFAMNASAYIGEMLRSGIEGVDQGQREAGLALGFTRRQTFFRIILPQVVKSVMPVYQGEVITLLKGTSIVGYIAIMDMTRASDLIRSRTFDAFFPLILTAAIYFLVAWLIGMLLNSLVEHRRRRAVVAAVMLGLLTMTSYLPDICAKDKAAMYEAQTDSEVPAVFLSLAGKSVGVAMGSIQDIAVTRYAPHADIQRYSSLTDMVAALQSGKIDVICQENITVTVNKEIATVVDTVDAGLPPTPVAACFQLGNTEMQQDFNNFLSEIRSNGTYQVISDRWLTTDDVSKLPVPHSSGTGKIITVATFPISPPFNFICSGELSGFEADILAQWANRRNYRLEYLIMDFASQIPAIQTGKADIAMGSIAATEERRKQVLFSDGYNEGRITFYTRKGEAGMLKVSDENSELIEDDRSPSGLGWGIAVLLLVLAVGGGCAWLLKRANCPTTNSASGLTSNSASGLTSNSVSGSIISVTHLKKNYGELEVLRDISFDVHQGEVISIIGPSGTGKSTLLRALNLLDPPTGGTIIMDGENILAKGYSTSRLRQKMGMVFQSFNLFEHLTVLDNVMYAPVSILHESKELARKEALALLRQVGLSEKAEVYPSSLSGGQKQRVAIARALAMKPEVILFDEPTSALDPTMVGEVLSVIRQLAKSGLTMLIVTHEMKFARDVSTRIFFMYDGYIHEDGSPEQIFDHPVHSATKAFVNRIRKLVYQIDTDDFDFLKIRTDFNQFCLKYNITSKADLAYELVEEVLFTHLRSFRPLTLRLTHTEQSEVTALDFMVENQESTPLSDTARKALRPQVKALIEEPTTRGFRVKLIL